MTDTTAGRARWIPVLVGGPVAAFAAVLVLGTAVLLSAVGARVATTSFAVNDPSATALGDIPANYLAFYRQAGERYSLDWAILAGIGKVETNHGRSQLPGVHSGVNCAGAAGPMQFGVGAGNHGCGDAGNAWATYGVDGDGDGARDVYDPADAIPAAARYLRASGAPGDYRRAILAYNHADWYVAAVLTWAERYRGALVAAAGGTGTARRVPFNGVWFSAVPGTGLRCDARIVPDVEFILRRFGLRLTACFAASGHAVGGEHPLGLATDLVPADGDWQRTMSAARFFGWAPECAGTGCAGRLRAPMRVVLYNGFPGHGDPAHCARPACPAHLHLSWAHAPVAPLSPASWVDVGVSQ
jgi:Transglycosylase SLT domain